MRRSFLSPARARRIAHCRWLPHAVRADSLGAVGGCSVTDVAAGPTVVGIRVQKRACSVAVVRTLIACILAAAIVAPAILVGARLFAHVSAGPAVVLVKVQNRACPIASDGPIHTSILAPAIDARGVLIRASFAAVVEAGSAVVGVIGEIGAGIAGGTGPTERPGVRIAVPAGRDTGLLLLLVGTLAEGRARIGLWRPHSGLQP